jgi:hypothetical protein
MSAQDLLAKLHKARKTGRENWIACCPAHEDKNPSMTIRECDDGRVLLHCFAGCSVGDILGAVGLDFDAIFPPKPPVAERLAPIRRPFPAADVLEALAHESKVVLLAIADVQAGRELNRERLSVAAERIERGRQLANG